MTYFTIHIESSGVTKYASQRTNAFLMPELLGKHLLLR